MNWVRYDILELRSYVEECLKFQRENPHLVICGSVDKALIGRRELWVKCSHVYQHEGNHWDDKRKHSWSGPHIPEFCRDYKEKFSPIKRKPPSCKVCGMIKRRRGDMTLDRICVCKAIGALRQQGIMFADERAKALRDELRNLPPEQDEAAFEATDDWMDS